jgi:hypothetical protein
MKRNSDTSRISTRLPTDDGFGKSVAGDPVLERASHPENASLAAGAGWSPYEVWCTRVRDVQSARSSNMRRFSRSALHERKGNLWSEWLSQAARIVAHVLSVTASRGISEGFCIRLGPSGSSTLLASPVLQRLGSVKNEIELDQLAIGGESRRFRYCK